ARPAARARATPSGPAAGVVRGSPHYMAPGRVRGATEVDARADIWSLAATLVHLITGNPPFPGPTMPAVFANILTGQPPPLDGLPAGLAATIRRALARGPAARFATAGERAPALRAPADPRRSIISRVGLVAFAAIAIASVGFFVGRAASSSESPESPGSVAATPPGSASPAPAGSAAPVEATPGSAAGAAPGSPARVA